MLLFSVYFLLSFFFSSLVFYFTTMVCPLFLQIFLIETCSCNRFFINVYSHSFLLSLLNYSLLFCIKKDTRVNFIPHCCIYVSFFVLLYVSVVLTLVYPDSLYALVYLHKIALFPFHSSVCDLSCMHSAHRNS